jgi:hypothetical protein
MSHRRWGRRETARNPGRCPGLWLDRPFRASDRCTCDLSANHAQPRRSLPPAGQRRFRAITHVPPELGPTGDGEKPRALPWALARPPLRGFRSLHLRSCRQSCAPRRSSPPAGQRGFRAEPPEILARNPGRCPGLRLDRPFRASDRCTCDLSANHAHPAGHRLRRGRGDSELSHRKSLRETQGVALGSG